MAKVELKSFTLNKNFDAPWNHNNELNIAAVVFDQAGKPFSDSDSNPVGRKGSLFKSVRVGKPVELPSGSFVLDFPQSGPCHLGLAVIENDADSRTASKLIDDILSNQLVKAGIVAGLPATAGASAAVGAILRLISMALGANTDDEVCKVEQLIDKEGVITVSSSETVQLNGKQVPIFEGTLLVVGVTATAKQTQIAQSGG